MSKKSSGLGKFLLGGAIGAGLALLFAPQKGSETRRQLKEKCDELFEKLKENSQIKNKLMNISIIKIKTVTFSPNQ